MKKMVVSVLLLLFFFLSGAVAGPGSDDDIECRPMRCGDGEFGPEIRFPFWLKNRHPDHCGYGPAFALTCSPTNTNTILLDNPFSVKVEVTDIDYFSQYIEYESSSGNYNDPQMQNLSFIFNTSPFSPFRVCLKRDFSCLSHDDEIYHIFSCPSSLPDPYVLQYYSNDLPLQIRWLSLPGRRHLYVLNSDYLISRTLFNCTRNYTTTSFAKSYSSFDELADECPPSVGGLAKWCEPNCRKCEENKEYCRLSRSNNSNKNETECFPNPYYMRPRGMESQNGGKDSSHDSGESETKRELLKGLIPSGIFLLLVLVMVTFFAHRSNNLKKEVQLKVERFLEDYRALKPTRYTYSEIKKVTHNLKDKLGQGGYGTVYKGELSNDIPIAAKILDNFIGNGEDFINEIGTIGMIHHVNVVRLVGYCADGYKKALLYEYMPNGSLDKFISSDHRKISLGSEKLQDIALGIAKGIEYLHQGCDQRILHFDIKPHNILLDKNFIPKISDFGLAKLCSKEQSVVSMTAARGTVGYIAPEVFSRNFGNVSHKSDVYSFGMLLLEIVGGRKKNIDVRAEENSDEVYFPEWIYNHLNREKVNNSEVEEGVDAKIVKKLTVVGLWCIQWYPGDRPSMKVVVQMLEGDGETLAMPPNPFSTTSRSIRRGNMGERPFSSNMLEIISESD